MIRADKKNEINGQVAFGVTKFSDLTLEEFSLLLGRKNKGVTTDQSKVKVKKPTKKASSTDSINWAEYGKVTPIKNQGKIIIIININNIIILLLLSILLITIY
jgi:hypothetical protein